MKATEKNFISLIRQQREEGILYVMKTYGGLLQSIVRKRLSAFPDRMEECMNDIFWGIWQNIDSFDESRGSFVNWAAGVARLEAIDALRKLQREYMGISLDEVEISQEDEALTRVVERELSSETEELLNFLSPRDRELFQRIFMDQEEPEEAGAAMGISRNNVYVRLSRGKKKLRGAIKGRKGVRL